MASVIPNLVSYLSYSSSSNDLDLNITTSEPILVNEETTFKLLEVCLLSGLVAVQLFELYYSTSTNLRLTASSVLDSFRRGIEIIVQSWRSLLLVIHDFRSGRYYVPWRDDSKNHVFVSSKKHIVELSDAPELSQRAVYADVFGFDITLANLSHNEQKASRYRLYGRILKVGGPEQLAILFPTIEGHLDRCVRSEVSKGYTTADGWQSVKLAPMIREINVEVMMHVFFGEKLTNDAEFSRAIRQHPLDLVKALIAFKLVPRFMRKFVHGIVTNQGEALNTCMRRLIPIMRRDEGSWEEDPAAKQGNDYWTPLSLSQAMLGIWLAAAFQPWMNLHFVVLELCARPEWKEAIREEIESVPDLSYKAIEQLPLLDSFIKEVFRTKPLDNYVIRRKALRPFTFSDGLEVPVGKIACVSTKRMMSDADKYPDPHTFVADRFVPYSPSEESSSSSSSSSPPKSHPQTLSSAIDAGCGPGSKLTDVSENFPIWGYGSLACPGRFHASFIMKAAVVHLLRKYEFKRADERVAAAWCWEHFTMPAEKTRVLFRARS